MEKKEMYVKLCILFLSFVILANLAYFSNNLGITGMATARISIFVENYCSGEQNINLSTGWTFNSFYLKIDNYSISRISPPHYVLEWDDIGQQFKMWSREGSKEFTEFNSNKSYFIFVDSPQSFSLCGEFYNNLTLPLNLGWDSPDYPYEYPSNVSNSTFYNANFNYMLKWDKTNQKFLLYSPASQSPEFNSINASEGYFIRTDGGILKYVGNASS